MKKKLLCLLIVLMVFATSGCFKRDNMEDINIITTSYPIEYVTNFLYGENSAVSSIYPKGVNITNYKITDKQIKDFSKYDLFVYNGKSSESDYAIAMINKNHNLRPIDATYGVETVYSDYDLWLNPANILMIGQNIRNDLEEYITNQYIISEIDNRYQLLKVNVSAIETEFKKTADNSRDKRIITSDETLKFLEKYGFEVINLTEKKERKETNIEIAKDLLSNKKLSYVFTHENDKFEDIVSEVCKNTKADKLNFRILENITDKDVSNGEDYLSLMNDNIELIKKETYK